MRIGKGTFVAICVVAIALTGFIATRDQKVEQRLFDNYFVAFLGSVMNVEKGLYVGEGTLSEVDLGHVDALERLVNAAITLDGKGVPPSGVASYARWLRDHEVSGEDKEQALLALRTKAFEEVYKGKHTWAQLRQTLVEFFTDWEG